MSAITFVTWDGAGNVAPALAVAAELRSRGHTVEVLGHESLASAAAAADVPFSSFRSARQWDAARPAGPLAMLQMFGDRAMGRDAVAHARQHGADLVVVDCLLFGVMDALRGEGISYVALEHVCDGFIRRAARGPFGIGLRLKRLRPLDLIDGAVARMTLTIPELDRGHGDVTHVGPVVRGTSSRASEPAVLLSLSTYAYPGMQKVWQRVLDAVDGLDARVVATTGPRVEPGELRAPRGVELHRWLDHTTILPEVTTVVCHGGHGTTVAALAHGVPVIAIPLDPSGDQPFLGDSLESLGAGRRLSKRAKPAAIRTAIESLMVDGPHRRAAAQLGESISSLDGRRRGADLLESLPILAGRTTKERDARAHDR
ncbi:MAG: glycosyltransferase [Ilumatobacteraceae bacterium]